MPTYIVDSERSTVLIAARSTVGPIVFEGRGLEGRITTRAGDRGDDAAREATATFGVDLGSLRSGNELYDAELRRRLDVRHHPRCLVELDEAAALGDGRFSVGGLVTVQDTTRRLTGTVEVGLPTAGRLTVVGEQTIDIRDFRITSPRLLMMRIYPELRVRLFLDAHAEIAEEPS